MSDPAQHSLLGAFFSKNPIAERSAGAILNEPGENTDSLTGVSDLFGNLFNIATAAKPVRLAPPIQTGIFTKQPPAASIAAIAPSDIDAAASAANSDSSNTLEVNLNRISGEGVIPPARFKELLIFRTETPPALRVINPSPIKPGELSSPSSASFSEEPLTLLEKGTSVFATVKLNEAQPQNGNSHLSTIKQAPPFSAAAGAFKYATKFESPAAGSKGPEIVSVLAPANTHVFESPGTGFDFTLANSESAPIRERRLEVRLTRPDTPAVRAEPAQTIVAKGPVNAAYGGITAGVTAQVDSRLLVDAEIRLDSAFAPSSPSSSVQGANALTLGTSPALPAQNSMAGVLPQIQAAVFSRNGRDVVEVRLDPPDLGRVRIDFNVENGETIKAVLGAERSETLDYLRRNIVDLENQLKQAGFSSISFEFSNADRQFGAEDAESRAVEKSIFDSDDVVDLRPKIYLSARENARLDLLL